jgi:hypothetical protein
VDERLLDTVRIAAGPWRAEGSPAIAAEGTVRLESFRIDETALTTLQMLAPMKAQLEALGWQVLFSCKDRDCGGFDFRYALEVLPPPEMHVSLGDYRYLSARGPDGAYLAILVSRARQTGFLQLTHVSAGATPVPALSTRSPDVTSTDLSSLGARLEAEGRVVLSDLDFGRGSAELGAGSSRRCRRWRNTFRRCRRRASLWSGTRMSNVRSRATSRSPVRRAEISVGPTGRQLWRPARPASGLRAWAILRR